MAMTNTELLKKLTEVLAQDSTPKRTPSRKPVYRVLGKWKYKYGERITEIDNLRSDGKLTKVGGGTITLKSLLANYIKID